MRALKPAVSVQGGDGDVGEGDKRRRGLLDRVLCPAVARQRADEEHRHAAGCGQAESVPPLPGPDAADGGELRHPMS